jgi:hypothetical protein
MRGSGLSAAAISSEHDDGPLGALKGGEFLGQFNDYQLLKKVSAP